MSVLLSKGGWNVNGYGTDATNIKKILLGLLGIAKNAKNCFKVVFYVFFRKFDNNFLWKVFGAKQSERKC